MRKPLARALSILLALAPWPALADVTATYKTGKDRLTVEVADNGDARVETGLFVYVRHGGEEYLTLGQADEDRVSGRYADMLKFFEAMFRAAPETAAPPEFKPDAPVLDPLSETEVQGFKGQSWRIWPSGKRENQAESVEVAFTNAPALAPIGHVLQSIGDGVVRAFAPTDRSGKFRAVILAMRDKGTLLSVRGGKTMVLDTVRTGPIDAKRFAVPDGLLSAEMLDALASRMKTEAADNAQP